MIQANEVLMNVGMKLKFSYPWHKIMSTRPWKELVEAEDCFYRYTIFIFLTITQNIRCAAWSRGIMFTWSSGDWGFNPIDPGDFPSNMRYFPRISPNSLKISPNVRATIHIQSLTSAHISITTKSFPLCLTGNCTGFNLIYWNPVCG